MLFEATKCCSLHIQAVLVQAHEHHLECLPFKLLILIVFTLFPRLISFLIFPFYHLLPGLGNRCSAVIRPPMQGLLTDEKQTLSYDLL